MRLPLIAWCFLICGVFRLSAGTFFTDFESTPPGVRFYGNAMVNPASGVNDSGVLRLTPTESYRDGTFIVEDIDGGRPVAGFALKLKMQIGGGGPIGADGMSVNFGPKLPGNIREAGVLEGLSVCFDTYVSHGQGVPNLYVRYNYKTIKSVKVPGMRTPGKFVDLSISMHTNGLLDVVFDGQNVFQGLKITGFKPIQSAEFGFGSRTGNRTDNHLIDELSIVTVVDGESVPKDALSVKTAIAAPAERAWFVNGSEVLEGCLYKPRGEGPFPAILVTTAEPLFLATDGPINPSPELSSLLVSRGYALFLPGRYEFNPADESIGALDRNGSRVQAAMAWLRVQSFVDPNRIFAVGTGPGAVDTLLGLAHETDVKGMAFLDPHNRGMEITAPVREHISQGLASAKSQICLVPKSEPQDDLSKLFATVLNSKPSNQSIKVLPPSGNATPQSDADATALWTDELFSFIEEVLR